MKKHKNISLRQPKATSLARSKDFNPEIVFNFFDFLKKIVDENQLDVMKIFNADENCSATVLKKCQKILVKREKHQVEAIVSGERGVNKTMVTCTNW